MKTRFGILLLACVAVTLPAFGQYTPYFTDQMQSYQSAYWTENYTSGIWQHTSVLLQLYRGSNRG